METHSSLILEDFGAKMDTDKCIQPKIYLIGSFHSFRDKIIDSLPAYSFADPRLHHQSCTAKMVVDDMREAEDCPIAIAVFPKYKSRGVMSYAEIGASLVNGNTLITVDEEERFDPLLKKLTRPDRYFTSLDTAIEYLASNPKIELSRKAQPQSKYPAGTVAPVPVDKIYFCGHIDQFIAMFINQLRKEKPDKTFIPRADDYEDFINIKDYDLIIANFPKNQDWDRHACLMLGGAYSHDISTLVMDGHDVKYPPLQALARRQMDRLSMTRYLREIEDLRIEKESGVMYNLFKDEQKRAGLDHWPKPDQE